MFELGLKENDKRVIIKSPTKIEQMYGTGGLHMKDIEDYKNEINRMVDEIKNLPLIIIIYTQVKIVYKKFLHGE